jgi:hypothetical protein
MTFALPNVADFTQIVFTSEKREIYVIDSDGANMIQLTITNVEILILIGHLMVC